MINPDLRARANLLLHLAYESMEEGRANKGKQIRRHFTRDWKYGGLKKKTAKVAVGVALGVIAVGVSVGTAGAGGVALIAGLAAGTYVVSQMTDGMMAQFWGREFKGATRTRDWMNDFAKSGQADQRARMFGLNERAHKTIRRAFQHYKKADMKYEDLQKLYEGSGPSCSDTADVIQAAYSVSHHLDKSLAYLQPAVLLNRFLLTQFMIMKQQWLTLQPKLPEIVEKALAEHKGQECEFSTKRFESRTAVACFAVTDFEAREAGSLTRPDEKEHVQLWTDTHVKHMLVELHDLDEKLPLAGFEPGFPPASNGASLTTVARTRMLFRDVSRRYQEGRTTAVKVKHHFTNYFARRTTGEIAAFAAGQVIKAGAAVGGGFGSHGIDVAKEALHGAAKEALPKFAEPLMETGVQTAENLMDWGAEKLAENQVSTGPLDTRSGRTGAGAEAQEALQKASVHMHEVIKTEDDIQSMLGVDASSNCMNLFYACRALYKIEHHLGKAQTYLHEAFEQTRTLGDALVGAIDRFKTAHDLLYFDALNVIEGGDHSQCDGCCYAGRFGAPSFPARPLV